MKKLMSSDTLLLLLHTFNISFLVFQLSDTRNNDIERIIFITLFAFSIFILLKQNHERRKMDFELLELKTRMAIVKDLEAILHDQSHNREQ